MTTLRLYLYTSLTENLCSHKNKLNVPYQCFIMKYPGRKAKLNIFSNLCFVDSLINWKQNILSEHFQNPREKS